MRKIIFTNADGGISIVYPVRNTIGETLTTDAEIEQRAWDKLPDDAINPQYVEDSAIPIDRTFRNAWQQNGNLVICNMTKAKDIAHNKRRAARSAEFAPHDEVIMKQIPGVDAQAAEAARQAIRDKYSAMQAQMDAAQSADELKALLPEV